jgi:hypothetical protein
MQPKEIREYAKALDAWATRANLTMQKAAEQDAKGQGQGAKVSAKIRDYAKELNAWTIKANAAMKKQAAK